MDRSTLVKEKHELQKTIQCKDKIIEDKDKLFQITNEKLSQTTRELEEKQNEILEKNAQLGKYEQTVKWEGETTKGHIGRDGNQTFSADQTTGKCQTATGGNRES